MSKRYFFITGLPRSRTAWLANFLTWGSTFCYHDGFYGLEQIEDIKVKLADTPTPVVGNSDPANSMFALKLLKWYPEAKWVVIKRPFKDAMDAARKAFGNVDESAYAEQVVLFKVIQAVTKPLTVEFKDISTRALEIASYLKVDAGGQARLDLLKDMQVQIEPHALRKGIHNFRTNPPAWYREEAA